MRTRGCARASCGDAFRRGEQADQADVARAAVLEPADGRDRRVAGRQHGVDDDGQPLRDVLGQLAVVFDRGERGGIAVDADVADARRGDEVEQAVEQAVAGAQDRHEHQLLALEEGCLHGADRRLDVAQLGRQVAQHLVAQQQRDLAQQRAELRRRRRLVAHQRELVRDQRVVDDDEIAHSVALHDVLVPQLGLLADEARHQGDAVGVVGDDHLDAALAQEAGIAGEILRLADDDARDPNWMMVPVHIMQGESEV